MPKKQKVPAHVQKALHDQAVKGQIKQPDLAKLTAYFFESAGGERQVARMLYEEFAASAPGGVVRQRILDMIMKAVKFTNDKSAPPDDLGVLSDDDIERELAALVESVGGKEGGDGDEQPGPDAGPAREEAPPPGPGDGPDPAPAEPAEPPGAAGDP